MVIGVPKEIKESEHRVGIVPPAAWRRLVRLGLTVLVQAGAGWAAGNLGRRLDLGLRGTHERPTRRRYGARPTS